MKFINSSTDKYQQSAKVATAAGHRPGSHEWWNAIRANNATLQVSKK